MAVSTTSFAERLHRAEKSSLLLYAGDETPQAYKSNNLINLAGTSGKIAWVAIVFGALIGAYVGHLFKTNIGIETFFAQPLLVVFGIVKADPMTAAVCLGMLAAPVFAVGFQILSTTKSRLSQFWWAYLAGVVGVNLTTWYAFYLSWSA